MDNVLTPNDFLTPHTQWVSEAKSTMGNDAVEDMTEDGLKQQKIVTSKRVKRTPKRQWVNPKPLGSSNELDVPLMKFLKKKNLFTKQKLYSNEMSNDAP